mmetsp:Transcript_30188/g.54805  ORF Transcript_30188/g.54805 Transcript_30188/m.54805 type:complete len:200 (-) Transcript_30188:292-891(-)
MWSPSAMKPAMRRISTASGCASTCCCKRSLLPRRRRYLGSMGWVATFCSNFPKVCRASGAAIGSRLRRRSAARWPCTSAAAMTDEPRAEARKGTSTPPEPPKIKHRFSRSTKHLKCRIRSSPRMISHLSSSKTEKLSSNSTWLSFTGTSHNFPRILALPTPCAMPVTLLSRRSSSPNCRASFSEMTDISAPVSTSISTS